VSVGITTALPSLRAATAAAMSAATTPALHHAVAAGEIPSDPDVAVAARPKQGSDPGRLPVADLDDEGPAVGKNADGGLDQRCRRLLSEQRAGRLPVAHLGCEAVAVGERDVRRVGHDCVPGPGGQTREEIVVAQLDVETTPLRVLAREGERVVGGVDS